ARRPFVGPDLSGHDQRGLVREGLSGAEGLLRHGLLEDDRLQIAGPIADDEELQLSARSLVMQPPAKGDFAPRMLPDLVDIHRRHDEFPGVRDGRKVHGRSCYDLGMWPKCSLAAAIVLFFSVSAAAQGVTAVIDRDIRVFTVVAAL